MPVGWHFIIIVLFNLLAILEIEFKLLSGEISCSIMGIPVDLKPTVRDFITAFGTEEASQLTTLSDPLMEGYLPEKIEAAIDQAFCLVDSYDARTNNKCAKYSIRKQVKRLSLDIARYYLDTFKPSQNVIKRYEDSIEWLKESLEFKDELCVLTDEDKALVGLEDAECYPIEQESECRVYTRDKSKNTWIRDSRWRTYNSRDKDRFRF